MATTSAPGRTQERPLPPGTHGLPLLGETLEFLRSPHRFADSRIARYGKVYQSLLLGKPTIFLIGAFTLINGAFLAASIAFAGRSALKG